MDTPVFYFTFGKLCSELPPLNLQKAEIDRNFTPKKQKVFSNSKSPFKYCFDEIMTSFNEKFYSARKMRKKVQQKDNLIDIIFF